MCSIFRLDGRRIVARLAPGSLFLVLVLLLFAGAQTARGFEFSGRLNALSLNAEDSIGQRGWSELARLRLELDQASSGFSLHLAYDNELIWGAAVRDPAFALQASRPQPTWLDATTTIRHSAAAFWRHSLYRGWIQYENQAFRATLGRQRIAWGSARIWNPTDRFNPVQPTTLEPDQKLGVDAASLAWRYSATASLQAVAAPGRADRGVSRKLALRWQATFGQTDIAAMAARIGEEKVLGLDWTANIGDAVARLEWMGSDGGLFPGFSQMAIGMDNTFFAPLFPQGLYLAVEYFHNSRPGPGTDRLLSRSHQLLGMSAGYDLTPLWRAELLAIADLEHPSWFAAPSLRWSASDNVDITALAQLFRGSGAGEFANQAALFLLRLDCYF